MWSIRSVVDGIHWQRPSILWSQLIRLQPLPLSVLHIKTISPSPLVFLLSVKEDKGCANFQEKGLKKNKTTIKTPLRRHHLAVSSFIVKCTLKYPWREYHFSTCLSNTCELLDRSWCSFLCKHFWFSMMLNKLVYLNSLQNTVYLFCTVRWMSQQSVLRQQPEAFPSNFGEKGEPESTIQILLTAYSRANHRLATTR